MTDHVTMDFTNKPSLLFVWLGLLCIGAVPAMINYNLISKPLLHCITVADSKLFIFDSEIAPNVEAIKDDLTTAGIRYISLVDPTEKVDLSWTECLHEYEIDAESDKRPPDSLRSGAKLTDMEMLMYTSGTTGLPKAAIISFSKLGFAPSLFAKWAGIKPSDRFYSCMPLYHATALVLGWAMCILAHSTYVLGHKFSAQLFWNEIRDSRATVIQYVGEMCRYLLAVPPCPDDKNHLVTKAFGNGMRPDVWTRFRNRFGVDTIAELYAATGMSSQDPLMAEGNGAQLNCNSGEYGAGSIGRMGFLAAALTRKQSVIVKIDPITEEFERDSNGLCIRVRLLCPCSNDRLAMERKGS